MKNISSMKYHIEIISQSFVTQWPACTGGGSNGCPEPLQLLGNNNSIAQRSTALTIVLLPFTCTVTSFGVYKHLCSLCAFRRTIID